MGIYEDRVKRLREHVLANEKKAEKKSEKPAELTNKQLAEMLDEMGIEYDKRATKATLLALLEKAQDPNNQQEPVDDELQINNPDDELDDDDEGAE